MRWSTVSEVRIISISSIKPRPEQRALARVSKDGHRLSAYGHPSRRRAFARLLMMRPVRLDFPLRSDRFHGIDLLVRYQTAQGSRGLALPPRGRNGSADRMRNTGTVCARLSCA